MHGECLGCGVDLDYTLEACPECGWAPEEFRQGGRHGLSTPGHGEPNEDESSEGGPPPGPDGLVGI